MATKINNIYLGNAPLLDATNSSNTDIPCSYNIVKMYNAVIDADALNAWDSNEIIKCMEGTNNVFRVFGVTYPENNSDYTRYYGIPFCVDLQLRPPKNSNSKYVLICVNIVYIPEGYMLYCDDDLTLGDIGSNGISSKLKYYLAVTAASIKETTGA